MKKKDRRRGTLQIEVLLVNTMLQCDFYQTHDVAAWSTHSFCLVFGWETALKHPLFPTKVKRPFLIAISIKDTIPNILTVS